MAKFSKGKVTSKVKVPKGPLATATVPTTRTALGALAYKRDQKSELFLLAVSNFVGVDLFHEKAPARDDRFEKLCHAVAVGDPEWFLNFVTWLRKGGNMRSASLVAGAEGTRALLAAGSTDGWARKLINAPLQRADEPGEMLAYWARYSEVKTGKALKLPKPVKRGVADAVRRLYTDRNLLKWDTGSKGMRFADVIELVHPLPDPAKPWQGMLFQYALDRRHERDNDNTRTPRTIVYNDALRERVANGDFSVLTDSAALRDAGMTWEDVLSLAGSKVAKRELWEAMIPNMGLFALARNLRNFSEAGISPAATQAVIAKLQDPEEVRKSMMFPFRFLAAYRNTGDLRWAYALEVALGHSLANVPALPGRTLILVDQSPSMFPGRHYSTPHKGDISLADQAKTFGVALALRAESADLVQYGQTSELVPFKGGDSMLKVMERFKEINGTLTPAAAQKWYAKHDRIVIVTDEQTATWKNPQYGRSWGQGEYAKAPVDWATQVGIPQSVPVYTWNLAGYQAGHLPGGPNRHTMGGLTDSSFTLISMLESGQDGSWPWEREAVAA